MQYWNEKVEKKGHIFSRKYAIESSKDNFYYVGRTPDASKYMQISAKCMILKCGKIRFSLFPKMLMTPWQFSG